MSRRFTPYEAAIESLESRRLLSAVSHNWDSVTIKANGFIDGIVYSPAQPNLVYAHTDMGGAYRWDQSAGEWVPLNDWSRWNDWPAQNLGVETMAVDPTDANRVYMAAGTYMSPTAILRSNDAGETWLRTDVSFNSNGNGSARNTGERMMVDPNSPNILFYGTRDDGLWKSSNYGATWAPVGSFPTIGEDTGFAADTGIVWVQFDKTSGSPGSATQTIYAGVLNYSGGLPRIYRSLNAGASWEVIPGGQPTTANYFPQRMALSPDGSAMYLTYASSTSYPGPYGIIEGSVYKISNPSAASPTWTDISPSVTYGFSAVAIDPTNPQIVYVGELNNYNPADRIWRSTTGGGNWTAINPNSHRNDSSAAYASSLGVHWLGDLQIDPFNRDVAMFTTGYGIYRTSNLTAAEPTWVFFNEGLEQSAVLELSSPLGGPVNLLSAIGDRDGYRHDNFAVSPALGRLGQNTGLARGTSDDIDASGDGQRLVRLVRVSPWVQYSNDNGVTWNWASSTNTAGSSSGGGNIAISLDGTKAVYEPGGTGRARYATRTGNTWSAWVNPATNQPANGAKIVADLVDPMTFIACAGNTVSRSTDGGANWTVLTTSAPAVGNWIRAVPNHSGHLWMSRNGNGLWRSTNGGQTWTQAGAGVVTTANAVGVGKGRPGGLYESVFVAGTVNNVTGFFRSDDQGATWIEVSDVDHQYGYITVIQGDPRIHGRLYVGANGRGVLFADQADLVAPTITSSAFSFETAPNTLQFTFSEDVAGSLSSADLVVERAAGGGAAVNYIGFDQTSLTASFTFPALLADGDYTARIDAAGVFDDSGNPLIAEFNMPFFIFSGDANHDRTVDIGDFSALAANFNSAGSFSDGDFNYDSAVNIGDFSILASKFNLSLPAQLSPRRPMVVSVSNHGARPGVIGLAPAASSLFDSMGLGALTGYTLRAEARFSSLGISAATAEADVSTEEHGRGVKLAAQR